MFRFFFQPPTKVPPMEPETIFHIVAGVFFLPWLAVPLVTLYYYRVDLKARKKKERLYK